MVKFKIETSSSVTHHRTEGDSDAEFSAAMADPEADIGRLLTEESGAVQTPLHERPGFTLSRTGADAEAEAASTAAWDALEAHRTHKQN